MSISWNIYETIHTNIDIDMHYQIQIQDHTQIIYPTTIRRDLIRLLYSQINTEVMNTSAGRLFNESI